MGTRNSPVEARQTALFPFLILVCFLSGCAGDSNPIVVDFRETAPLKKPALQKASNPPLKVAIGAMVSPKETFTHYRELFEYVGRKIGRPVELIQRKTYLEINQLLGRGEIDIAFICSGPYVNGREEHGFQALAVPQVQGGHIYRSYLIVNQRKSYRRLPDLRGRVFAFTDPESNTGRLAPTHWLHRMGEKPESFFSQVLYTYSHDNSILAVSRGLVDGAAVDSLVWEYYRYTNPEFTRSTRIILKSEPYAIPPIVASRQFPREKREQIRHILVNLHGETEGRHILQGLMIERFIAPPAGWFEKTGELRRKTALLEVPDHDSKKP